jgi:hypothetical protein
VDSLLGRLALIANPRRPEREMKKAFVSIVLLVAVAALLLVGDAIFFAQRADYGWQPQVDEPTFEVEHPRVLFEEGHNNAATAGVTGRYWQFARLLRADGYRVERSQLPFSEGALDGVRVLVIADAAGAPRPQAFGINLTVSRPKGRSNPAFTAAEVEAVRSWVEAGGSLLLIADHAPFGHAAASLASALGVGMHEGFVEVPGESPDPLLFSFDNNRLGRHPIIDGARPGTVVSRVMTYTGQSLDGPPGATTLLLLPRSAVESVPAGDESFAEKPAARAQAIAFGYGRGRVVVLGEGGMATAQVHRRVRFGINDDNDNQQFVLNVMGWLAHAM